MELQILHAIQGMHTEWLDTIMIALSTIGNAGIIWIILSIVLAIIPKTRKCGLTMMCSMALSFVVGNILLKNIIGRARPCSIDTSVSLLIPFPSEYSFPSGHTLNGFTAAVTLFLFHKKSGIIAIIIAGLIAFSRMYLFVHYPTDILGGIIIGIIDACIVVFLTRYSIKKPI